MPHLCFTPLTTATHHNISLGDSTSSSAVEKSTSLSAPFLFIREVNTKSSFALELPIAWLLRETIICEGDADFGEAEACISSYNTHTSNDSIDDSACETFLFGGFELIANVKTVEVYAVRSLDSSTTTTTTTTTTALADGEETYLTTCKGLPMRDLPALPIIPHCIEGTATATATTTIGNIQNGDDGEGINKTTEPENELYYKFIFVLPGGPKPMERVRLKFVQPIDNKNHGSLIIIVRTLKVKGRLSDAMSSPTKAKPTPSIIANSSEGTNSNDIINDLATGGGNGYNMSTTADGQSKPMGLQMDHQQRQDVCQMIPQEVRQMIPPSLSSSSSSSPLPRDYSLSMKQQQQQQQQHNNHHQHERNQAEIMSILAGLGMFLRSSEERMTMKIETMLSSMETRINERLDNLVARIDEFDVRSKGSTDT